MFTGSDAFDQAKAAVEAETPTRNPEIRFPIVLHVQGSPEAVLHAIGQQTEGFETYARDPEYPVVMYLMEAARYRVRGTDLADNEQLRVEITITKKDFNVKFITQPVVLPAGVSSVRELEVLEASQRGQE